MRQQSFSVIVILAFLAISGVFCDSLLLDFITFENSSASSLSQSCSDECQELSAAIKLGKTWALKVEDASGRKPSEFYWGNNYFLGSEMACQMLDKPIKTYLAHIENRLMNVSTVDEASEVPVEYRMIYLSHKSSLQFNAEILNKSIIHIGLCLPKSCSETDLEFLSHQLIAEELKDQKVYGEVKFMKSKRLGLRPGFVSDIFVTSLIVISAVFLLFVLVATLTPAKKPSECNNNVENVTVCKTNRTKGKTSALESFLECFSVSKNYNFVMSDVPEGSIKPIHGFRGITSIWICAVHIPYFSLSALDNFKFAFSFTDSIIYQVLFSSSFVVDIFFTISGLVLAYSFLEREKKRRTKNCTVEFFTSTLNRYLRTAPCMWIISLIAVVSSMYVNDSSQFYQLENQEEACRANFWYTFFYVQNFLPFPDICINWSWFLAADFQLFLVGLTILLIWTRNRKMATAIASSLALFSFTYSMYYGIVNKFGVTLDSQYSSIDVLYTKPYGRFNEYFMGMFTGYLLSETNGKLKIAKIWLLFWQFLGIAALVSIFAVSYFSAGPNFWVDALLPPVGRLFWVLHVCVFVLFGTTHPDGVGAKILNLRIFLPLSRMSFSAYLLNPILISLFVMMSQTSFHMDFFSTAVFTAGIAVFMFLCAMAFMLVFENPITFLKAKLFKKFT